MAIVGCLEDVGLVELFQLLALFRKSGKLTLSRGDTTGVFLFNRGKIFHAANGYAAPTVGELLVDRRLITREALDAAVATQRMAAQRKKLGAILVEMGATTRDALQKALRQQLEEIAHDFLAWDSGYFSFKAVDVDVGQEEEEQIFDEEAKLTEVVNIDPFILDLVTRVDAIGGAGSVRPSLPRLTRSGGADSDELLRDLLDHILEPSAVIDEALPFDEVREWPSELAELRSMMTEIQRRPEASTGEIALLALRYATRILNRGVLLGVSSRGITGIGQFGVGRSNDDTPNVTNRIRHIQIPLNEPSVLAEVIERKVTYHGRLEQCPWNNYLVDQLGGLVPPEVVVTPILVEGRVAILIYGDNLPGGHPITSIHGLELLAIEAGLAIEKNILREKLRSVQRTLSAITGGSDESGDDSE
jgi:hypothetical protein